MKLSMKTANNIAGATGVIGGFVIVVLAFVQDLDFIKKELPGPGFFPVLCGVWIIICSLFLIGGNRYKSKQAAEESDHPLKKNLVHPQELKTLVVVVGLSVLVILTTPIVGLLPAIAVAVMAMVRVLGKEGWLFSVLLGAGTMSALYLVFVMFLDVPLPWGMLVQ